jgi:periplasmic protein TonB
VAAHAPRLAGPIGASALLHVGVVSALLLLTTKAAVVTPPIYKVDIVAAPPGKRAIGIVPPTPAPPAPPITTPPPPAHDVAPTAPATPVHKQPAVSPPAKATPMQAPPKAKPVTPQTPVAKAGGGPTGGAGADVATVHIEGIDFPFPGYLENIVRQVALNFTPPDPSAQLKADVAFLIRRDGTVFGFKFVSRSGDYSFDLEAQGAIEKAAKAFGPLPDGFHDDVLPVVFSFDPRLLH